MNEVNWKVGEGATINHWTDRSACTVIEVSKSGKRIKIQRDKATLLNGMNSDAEDKLTCEVGGFAGHVSGRQRYDYERDENGSISEVSLRKNGKWILKGSNAKTGTSISEGRREHYDYNF